MNVKEFKEIADALARFATTREKAQGPTAFIGLQAGGGRLKLISGNEQAGMIVDVGETDTRASYAFPSRTFLQSAKVIPAKSEVEFIVTDDYLSVSTSGGGSLRLQSSADLGAVGFARKPREFSATARVEGSSFERISRLFKEVDEGLVTPTLWLTGTEVHATVVAPGNYSRYVDFTFKGEGEDGYGASAYTDFWDSLRALSVDGDIRFGHSGVVASSGRFEAFSGPYLVSKYVNGSAELPHEPEAWPVLGFRGDGIHFTMDRRNLISIVKGQAPGDEHNRITLQVETGIVKVCAFGADAGMTIPVETSGGVGVRSVSAEYLTGLLSAIDSKNVTIRLGGRAPAISIEPEGYAGCTILLAPTALR